MRRNISLYSSQAFPVRHAIQAMNRNLLQYAAEQIEAVVAGKLEAQAALRVWPHALNKKHPVLSHSWTCLRHFADDKDLHQSDEEYFAAEQKRLQACALQLHQEAGRLAKGARNEDDNTGQRQPN